jgi:hypothetical protein
MMPISSSGEILCRIADWNTGHMVSILWEDKIFEVDRLWNRTDPGSKEITIRGEEVLDTREKVIIRIKLLEQVIEYHYSDDLDIPEELESFYANLWIEFESWYSSLKDVPTGDLAHIHFGQHLVQMKHDLGASLKDIEVSDTTKIDEWKEQWQEGGISAELPQESNHSVPQVRWAKLEIIK